MRYIPKQINSINFIRLGTRVYMHFENSGPSDQKYDNMNDLKKPFDPDSESNPCVDECESIRKENRSFNRYKLSLETDRFYERQQEVLLKLRHALQERRLKRERDEGKGDQKHLDRRQETKECD